MTTRPAAERARLAPQMGFRLRAVRLAMGCHSAAAFGRLLELPASTVRRCEAGRLVPNERMVLVMLALNKWLGVDMFWFVTGRVSHFTPWRQPAIKSGGSIELFPYWKTRPTQASGDMA